MYINNYGSKYAGMFLVTKIESNNTDINDIAGYDLQGAYPCTFLLNMQWNEDQRLNTSFRDY